MTAQAYRFDTSLTTPGNVSVVRIDPTQRYVEVVRLSDRPYFNPSATAVSALERDRYPIYEFAKAITVAREVLDDDGVMLENIVNGAGSSFYDNMVKNSTGTLFISDSEISRHQPDVLRDQEIVSYRFFAGGPTVEFWKSVFAEEVAVPVEPKTLRECFRYMWKIVKGWFKHGNS